MSHHFSVMQHLWIVTNESNLVDFVVVVELKPVTLSSKPLTVKNWSYNLAKKCSNVGISVDPSMDPWIHINRLLYCSFVLCHLKGTSSAEVLNIGQRYHIQYVYEFKHFFLSCSVECASLSFPVSLLHPVIPAQYNKNKTKLVLCLQGAGSWDLSVWNCSCSPHACLGFLWVLSVGFPPTVQ